MEKRIGHIDWYILLPVAGLMLFSIAFVYSASAYFAEMKFGSTEKLFWNHGSRVLVALLLLVIFSRIDYHLWNKLSKIALMLTFIPLVLVFFVGTEINGAYRWIDLGPLNFQPSELAKFSLVMHLATLLTRKQEVIKDFKKGLFPLLFWTLSVTVLIALQPNFSTAMVIFLISVCMMFVGNTNLLHLLAMALVCLTGAGIYAVSANYRLQRILAFIGASDATSSAAIDKHSFQAEQAILAFGNGGLFGVGAGQSKQSHLFLPESYGDYIYSIVGEEYGFIGVVMILLVYGIIFWRGMLVAKKAPDAFGYFLAMGILITFAFYVLVSTAVNVGLLPSTGLPLPFISYGGTAVLFYASAMGILLNISAQAGVYPRVKKTDASLNQN